MIKVDPFTSGVLSPGYSGGLGSSFGLVYFHSSKANCLDNITQVQQLLLMGEKTALTHEETKQDNEENLAHGWPGPKTDVFPFSWLAPRR